ncbi:MAG: hypothetical protein V3R45_04640, partial [Candidatus Aminicenantaceae bacterium]
MRKILANLAKALKRGDTRILASMKEIPKPTIVVRGDQLSSFSIRKWMMELDQMSAVIQGGLSVRNPWVDPLGYARMAFRRNELIATLAQNMIITRPDISGGAVIQSRMIQSSTRFRDWNPDVKVANRLGVTIKYSSLENAVRVPELERTSGRGRVEGFNTTRGGFSRISGTSSGGSTSSSSSSGSRSSSGFNSSSSSSSRGSNSSSSKSSGSKTIKKSSESKTKNNI